MSLSCRSAVQKYFILKSILKILFYFVFSKYFLGVFCTSLPAFTRSSPGGATTEWTVTADEAYYSLIDPVRKKRLSWPCWLTDSGRLTHKVIIRPASSQAQDRESSPLHVSGVNAALLLPCSYRRSSSRLVLCSTFTSRRTTRSSEKVSRPSTCRSTRRRWSLPAPSCLRPPRPTAPPRATSRRGPRAEENRLRQRRRQRRNSRRITATSITSTSATISNNIYGRKLQDSLRDTHDTSVIQPIALSQQWGLQEECKG